MLCREEAFSFGSIPHNNPFKDAQASAALEAFTNGTAKAREEVVINLESDSSMTLPSEEDEEVGLLTCRVLLQHIFSMSAKTRQSQSALLMGLDMVAYAAESSMLGLEWPFSV